MDLEIDKNNNVWIAFVTIPKEPVSEGESSESETDSHLGTLLNVVALDKSGEKIGEISVPSSEENSDIRNPILIAVENGVMVGYSNNDEFHMTSMQI